MRVLRRGGDGRRWAPAAFLAGAAAAVLGGWALLRGREEDGAPSPDARELRRRVRGLPGGGGVGVRVMGEGIVELVGDAPSDEAARAFLEEVRNASGVEVVVNRLWTPSSRTAALREPPDGEA